MRDFFKNPVNAVVNSLTNPLAPLENVSSIVKDVGDALGFNYGEATQTAINRMDAQRRNNQLAMLNDPMGPYFGMDPVTAQEIQGTVSNVERQRKMDQAAAGVGKYGSRKTFFSQLNQSEMMKEQRGLLTGRRG